MLKLRATSSVSSSNKRDFGSFFNSNVEELLNESDADYCAPKYKIPFERGVEYTSDTLIFGSRELRLSLFNLSDEFCFLNHGAFGLTFKPVIENKYQWETYAESQPLRFYDREIMPMLVDVIRNYSANVFQCSPSELMLVDNCTFAFNSIVKIKIFKTRFLNFDLKNN
jgi:isopenicillin-N epimerase